MNIIKWKVVKTMVLSLQLRTLFTVVSFCTHALHLSAIPVPLCMVGFQFMHQFEKVFLWILFGDVA